MNHIAERRPKRTRLWVFIADKLADYTITVGGTLVIAAVLAMMVFLIWEVLPLFKGGSVVSSEHYTVRVGQGPVPGLSMDEYKSMVILVGKDGLLTAWHSRTGTTLEVPRLDLGGKSVTASCLTLDNLHLAFGFSDGTVRLASMEFKAEVFPQGRSVAGLREINATDSTDGSAIYSKVPGNQIRKVSLEVKLEEEILASETKSPIVAIQYRYGRFAEKPRKILATADSSGGASLTIVGSKTNLLTRKVTSQITTTALPALPTGAAPCWALVNDMADGVLFAEKDGKTYRYNTRDLKQPILAETVNLLPSGVDLTALGYLLGDQSIVVGGSDGSVSIFFLLQRNQANTADSFTLVKTRGFEAHAAAVRGISPSQRGKSFATFDAKGNIMVRQGTTQETLLRFDAPASGESIGALILAPRLDGMVAVGKDGRTRFWELSIPHPETSFRTLFGKIWYEGYPEPSYTWQSTGATEAFEPKLSLIPLIFGTLKATFYSLLFAVPVALLAAIYTSEFLPGRVRGKVKPVMEVMASIPSVVLGFVAALVLSPVVETWIAAVILAFVVLPASLVISSLFWQLLPPSVALRLEGLPKLFLMAVIVTLSLFVTYLTGPFFEQAFFDGNFRVWVSGATGRATPLLFLMLVPLVAIGASVTSSKMYGRRFHLYLKSRPMPYSALLDLARWVVMAAVTMLIAYALAALLSFLGVDPRGSVVDTYVQRNTLVVSFAMGFAVIPIIYTLAEDALNAVPQHLRSASLACGATPWQTAIWIILPTAISGVFSAMMIGMGRAVGETMIVVMSAGNTPLMDINIFDGLRALSANIAVELPEAPKDGTLYRVLFMTGLVLFSMTFVINTIAEIVRLRFRKRAMTL